MFVTRRTGSAGSRRGPWPYRYPFLAVKRGLPVMKSPEGPFYKKWMLSMAARVYPADIETDIHRNYFIISVYISVHAMCRIPVSVSSVSGPQEYTRTPAALSSSRA